MSWLDRLQKGRWRGFEFLTDSHDASFGRRLVVQQYPHRDEPDVEDFGKKAVGYRVNAYFIGDDYDLEANGFLAKLSQDGADWLTHPWLGDVWVRPEGVTRSERVDQGGYCVITIDFVPGGAQPYEPTVDKVDVAISRVRETQTVIADTFDLQDMSGDVLDDFIADVQQELNGLRKMIALATLPLTKANRVLNVINGVKTDVDKLLGLPRQYANAMGNFANVLSFLDDADEDLSVAVRVRAVRRISAHVTNPPAINRTSTQTAVLIANTNAEQAMRQQMLVTAAVGLAITTYQDADTRDGVLSVLLEAIDSLLNVANADVFDALLNLRSSMIDALLDQDLSRYRQRTLVNFMPTALVAQQFGVAESDFITINGIAHPLFVAGAVYG